MFDNDEECDLCYSVEKLDKISRPEDRGGWLCGGCIKAAQELKVNYEYKEIKKFGIYNQTQKFSYHGSWDTKEEVLVAMKAIQERYSNPDDVLVIFELHGRIN